MIPTPVAAEAEQAVLGGLMLRPAAIAEVQDWLPADAFFNGSNRVLYAAIVDLVAKGQPVDAVTMGEYLEAHNLTGVIEGGVRYVYEIANATPSAANIAAYAEIVVEKWKLRRAMDAGAEIVKAAGARGARSQDVAGDALRTLSTIAQESRLGGPVSVRSILVEWYGDLTHRYEHGERLTGVETPWRELNDLTLGWQPGDLIVIAGRSNMGKTALALQAAGFAALRGTRVGVFELEMSRRQVVQRMVAAFGEVSHAHLRNPKWLPQESWGRITEIQTRLHDAPLVIDDQAGLTVAQIVARVKREQMRAPFGLVMVDHLQLIKRPHRQGARDDVEIGEITKELKALAKSIGCPVLLLSQLNRGAAARSDHRPIIGDLRGSGEIEEDADLILFAHREDYYDDETHLKGVVELIVGKGRDMPTGQTINLQNRFDQMRAEDWSGALPEKPKTQRKAKGLGGNPGADKASQS